MTLAMVKEAEATRDATKAEANEAATLYQDAKAVLREQQQAAEGGTDPALGIPVQLKDLNDVLIMDVGDKVCGGAGVCCLEHAPRAVLGNIEQ